MKVLIAPDKFKGSLTAVQVCRAIERGISKCKQSFDITSIPLADGGDGSLQVIGSHLDLQSRTVIVSDPLGRPIKASYLYSSDTAYIELAAASGLSLMKDEERDSLATSTFGTGELIADARKRGLKTIYLFVGGSATNDAGLGILDALGFTPLGDGQRLDPIGANLPKLTGFQPANNAHIDIEFILVSDVMNPLYGPSGAAFVYAPQKGADQQTVSWLDDGLRNVAKVVLDTSGKRVDDLKGAGAAGGVAAGLSAFFQVNIRAGIEAIMEIVGLSEKVQASDVVVTGEGKFDRQTLQGKVVKGVYDLCASYQKKLVLICGIQDLDTNEISKLDFWKVSSLVRPGTSLSQAQTNAKELLADRAYELFQGIS